MRRALMALVLAAGGASGAGAQTPAGPDFPVTVSTTIDAFAPRVAMGGAGGFVVAFTAFGVDGDGAAVLARRFDVDGQPLGPEFQVNTATTDDQEFPSVAVAPNGDFTVAWTYWDDAAAMYHPRARQYDRQGVPLGPEVHLGTVGDGSAPRVAYDGRGNTVFVWVVRRDPVNADVLGQRYDRRGQPLGAEFRAGVLTTMDDFRPTVAAGPDGRFVVAWERIVGSFGRQIVAQRFDAAGAPIGAEFVVSAPGHDSEDDQEVAMNESGEFAIAWLDGAVSPGRVKVRCYDAAGAARGGELTVDAPGTATQGTPVLAADAAGRFVVVWHTTYGGQAALRARRIGSAGVMLGSDFRIDTPEHEAAVFYAIGSDPSGNLVASWDADGGDVLAVRARRFGVLEPGALRVDTAAGPGSDGNGVLEPGEGVDVRPSWSNHSGGPRTAAGRIVSLTGPPGSYAIIDGSGDYGTVADRAAATCTDCYAVSAATAGPRPATHWDASVVEALQPDTLGPRGRWLLHVGDSFGDVPRGHPYYRFVETLLHRGVTAGCMTGTVYCPEAPVARDQMAVFTLVSKEGTAYTPPRCGTPRFADVPAASPFCPWVEELARRGVVGGCGGSFFCPSGSVSRAQMAVFVLRTLDPLLNPPPCTTPVFGDVPAASPYCRWVEELVRRGIAAGCGGGNFCPDDAVSRGQMSVFLAATFGLTLYGN